MNTNKQLIIIILLCIVGSFCCKAQSLSSIEEQYIDQISEDAVVVCINPSDNNSTIICYNDSLYYRPSFVYHTHTGTGVSKRFKNIMDDTAMVLLHRGLWDNGDMASTLLFPKWGHYGQIEGLLADYRYNTSIDIHKNRFIRLGGTSWLNNDVLHYHLDKLHSGSSCYSTRPTFLSEELEEKDSSNTFIIIPEWINKSPILWSSYAMTYTTITNNNSCETNYLLKQ